MATYIPNITDVFPQPYIFKPDLAFYDKMLQRKTALYEEGVAKAKSAFDSVLYSPLSNNENILVREEYIKQAKANLQKMAGMDFAQAQNVAAARGIFAPFWEDKFIMKDSQITKAYQNEMQILDGWKNSDDPKVRENYNGIAAKYLQNGLDVLVNAKRNDQEFSKIEKRKAVPFTNIQKYLEEAASKDKDGLKIVWDESHPDGAYLIKTTNGERSTKHFREWALSQIGNNFYEQFNVTGKVENEERVKFYKSKFPNLTETQIREKIADDVVGTIDKGYHSTRNAIQAEMTRIDGIINAMPKVLTSQEQKLIDQYIFEKAQLQGKLDETDFTYNVNNSAKSKEILRQNIIDTPDLYFSLDAKEKTVSNWAKGRASITSKEVRENQVFTNAQINHRENRRLQLEIERENRLRQEGIWKREDDLFKRTQKGKSKTKTIKYDADGNVIEEEIEIEGVDPETGLIYKAPGTTDVSKEGNALEIFNREQDKNYSMAFTLPFNKNGLLYFAKKGLGLSQMEITHIETALNEDYKDADYVFTPEQDAAAEKLKKILNEHPYVKNAGIRVRGPVGLRDALAAYTSGYLSDRYEKDPEHFSLEKEEFVALMNYNMGMRALDTYNANEKNRKNLLNEYALKNPKVVDKQFIKDSDGNYKFLTPDDISKDMPTMQIQIAGEPDTKRDLTKKDVARLFVSGQLSMTQGGFIYIDGKNHVITKLNGQEEQSMFDIGKLERLWNSTVYDGIVKKYGESKDFVEEYKKATNSIVPNLLFYQSRTAKQGVQFYGKFGKEENDKNFIIFNEALSSSNADIFIEKQGVLKQATPEVQTKIRGLLADKEKSAEKIVEGFTYVTVSGETTDSRPYISFMINSANLNDDEKKNLGQDLLNTPIKLAINSDVVKGNLKDLPQNLGYYMYQDILRGKEIKSDDLMEKTGFKFKATPNRDGKGDEAPSEVTLEVSYNLRKNVRDKETGQLKSILEPASFTETVSLVDKTPDEIMNKIYSMYYDNLTINRTAQEEYDQLLKTQKDNQLTPELVDRDEYLRRRNYKTSVFKP